MILMLHSRLKCVEKSLVDAPPMIDEQRTRIILLVSIDIIISVQSEMLWITCNMEQCATINCVDTTVVSMLSCATNNGHHVGGYRRDKDTLP